MSVTPEEHDRLLARSLALPGGLLVGAWIVAGLLLAAVHLLDALRLRHTFGVEGSTAVVPLGAFFIVTMLWMVGFGALVLGVALAVTALVLDGSTRRGLLFLGLTGLGAGAQLVFQQLGAYASVTVRPDQWSSALLPALGLAAAPLLVLAAVVLLLRPLVGTPRSTSESAAAG
jgi:hypothetical protein